MAGLGAGRIDARGRRRLHRALHDHQDRAEGGQRHHRVEPAQLSAGLG
jgi:hypothetical protein